eukprot:COSAG02_NODE_346_length_24113_cov_13.213001_26_plen_60_part_01
MSDLGGGALFGGGAVLEVQDETRLRSRGIAILGGAGGGGGGWVFAFLLPLFFLCLGEGGG